MTTAAPRRSTRLSQRINTPEGGPRASNRFRQRTVTSSDDSGPESEQETTRSDNRDDEFKVPKVLRTPRKTKAPEDTPEERLSVTPPKQKKCDNNDENVDSLSPQTPSGLLKRLSLANETSSSSRKSLFGPSDVYRSARKALHSTYPTEMPGRETEVDFLTGFIEGHLEEGSSGSLYVSGPPGTGKTASLNLVLSRSEIQSRVKQVYVNCTAIKSSGAVFSKLANDLGIKVSGKSERDYCGCIESYLRKKHKSILLVLDEIDQLDSKKQSVLYTIFEWPSNPSSNLILIGIANALDLTDRILPRLQARCELKPRLLHFAPYTKQQIVDIFTGRLKQAGVLHVFSPAALQMLAGKVAAVSGDVRRALDIGRRVIELVDNSKSGDEVLQSLDNNLIDRNGKRVELTQVVGVLSNVYGTTQSLADDDDCFPLQQKIVVCSLILILNKGKNRDVTIGRLHQVYRDVCDKRNIQAVDQSEFVGICSLIETRGIVRIMKKKDPRMAKVALVWDEGEVAGALKDKQLMSSILRDDCKI